METRAAMKIVEPISTTVRRRYILGKQGLWPGRRWAGKQGTADALREQEAVQIDPVSIIAQSHDIVLWGRVHEYRPEYLDSLLYVERKFFDYGGGLMIYPIEELPYWRVMMQRRMSEKRLADFARANPELLDEVRRAIRARGPLRNRDIEGKPVTHYRASKDTGVALYYLWLTGELMTYGRRGKERIYDFLENVAPANWRWSAAEDEAIQFFTRKAISHLGFVRQADFRNILSGLLERPVDAREVKSKLAGLLEDGQLGTVSLQGSREPLYFLASDTPLLETLCAGQIPRDWAPIASTTAGEITFLSPLERVSARGRAGDLFDFDYIWEIYKPAAKRKYGPYTLPVLYGDRLVARMDAKLDRASQTLLVNGFWLEDWFEADLDFAAAFAASLLNFARFLGVRRLDTAALNPALLRAQADVAVRSHGMSIV
jgi:uncharacterized protein